MGKTNTIKKPEQEARHPAAYDPAVAFWLVRQHAEAIKSILYQVEEDTAPARGLTSEEQRNAALRVRWAAKDLDAASRAAGLAFAHLGVPAAQRYVEGHEPKVDSGTITNAPMENARPELPCRRTITSREGAWSGFDFYMEQLRRLVRRKNKTTMAEFFGVLDKARKAAALGFTGASFAISVEFRQDPRAICEVLDTIAADMAEAGK